MLNHIPVVTLSVLHIDRSTTTARKLVTIAKYAEGSLHDAVPPSPSTVNTLQINQHTLSNIRNVASTDPAPLIPISVSSLHDSIIIKVLPDSGADISAAGTEILCRLNEHVNNLLPSQIIPRAVNGAKMHPIGKLPVKLKLGDKEYSDDFHIYPNIQGTLISWKACKQLSILPECYPHPITHLNKLAITIPSPDPPPPPTHLWSYHSFHWNMLRINILLYLMNKLDAWKVKSFTSP